MGRRIPLVAEVASTRKQADILSRVLGGTSNRNNFPRLIVQVFIGRNLQRMFRCNDCHGASLPFSDGGSNCGTPLNC
jgi:hypothetical protein